MRHVLTAFLLIVLSGCATPIPFNTVQYKGDVVDSHGSTRTARLSFRSGTSARTNSTQGSAAAGYLIEVTKPGDPALDFNEQDQSEFLGVLRDELLRLKVFDSVYMGDGPTQGMCRATVEFKHVFHSSNIHEYQLDVVLHVEAGGKPYTKQYHINSNDGVSLLVKLNTNAYDGKIRAVQNLLNTLVPEIAMCSVPGNRGAE
jgi:hypothetical protein